MTCTVIRTQGTYDVYCCTYSHACTCTRRGPMTVTTGRTKETYDV